MFGRRKRERTSAIFDKTGKEPVLRCSICTGEQVAGFRDQTSGRFQEVMLIRNEEDLREFLERYQVEESDLRRVY